MNDSGSRPCFSLKDRFTWWEKLIARACMGGAILAAAIAIYRDSRAIALGYLGFVALGAVLVIYDSLCVYCPYPFNHADCLFYPYQLIAWVTRLRDGSIHWLRKVEAAVVFGGIFAVPQRWLWGKWGLFALFWAMILPLAVLVPLHLCRRCRHQRCPLNRATVR